ncbi:MAG: class B sortase [Eubacteriales bacterium]|nr:class B sortase [Eubacteriales bacterium]
MKKNFKIALIVYAIAVVGFVGYELTVYLNYQNELKSIKNLSELIETMESTSVSSEPVETTPTIPSSTVGETKPQEILPQYKALYEQNKDMIGWLKIEDSVVNYPIMFTPTDGDYYLYRDFEEKDSKHGLPFIDYRSNINPRSTNVLIHGHNMKDGTMFAALGKYQSKSYFENHKTIQFDTIYEPGEYEIFAAFMTQIYPDDSTEFMYYQFIQAGTQSEFNDYVQNALDLSIYDTKIIPEYGDELLTLSTCSYQVNDGRMVVVARRIVSNSKGAIS